MIENGPKERSEITDRAALLYFRLIDELIKNYEENYPNADRKAIVKQIMTGIKMVQIDKERNLPVLIDPPKSK